MKVFASLSHELRTPLNCSISLLHALLKNITDQEIKKRFIIPAYNSNRILLNLVNDILDYVQLDIGNMKF
jgi:signal transduction histidine kinase